MNIDEFPSLDFLLPYTGNTLQTKLLLGALAGLVFGIMLILLSSILIIRVRRKRRKRSSAGIAASGGSVIDGGNTDGENLGIIGQDNIETQTSAGTIQQSFGGGIGGDLGIRAGGLAGSIDSLDKNPDIIPSQGKLFK